MSLRGKVLGLIIIPFVVYGALDYGVQRLFTLPSFSSLEQEESRKDMGRAVQAIAREIEHLGSSAADWALWDDTYQYTQDRNDDYQNANLNQAALVGLNINAMFIFDEHHQLVWGMAYDLDNEQEIALEGLEQRLAHLRFNDQTTTVDGVILTGNGPLLVSAKPILTSNSEGPPKGYLVMGRFLDAQTISDQVRITLQIMPLAAGAVDPEIAALAGEVAQHPTPYILEEEKTNKVYTTMSDIDNMPALLLEVDVPRSITARGQRAVAFALSSLLGAGIVIIALLIVVIQHLVLNPLRNLTNHAVAIGQSNDLSTRFSVERNDEIGILGKEFNSMIQQLAAARKTLMDQSYHSGREEVAVNVLHSVGNALNGVVVSSYQLLEKARHSCGGDVTKLAALLQQPAGELTRFLTEDPRGMLVPHYLESVGKELEEERRFVENEALALQSKVNHIKDIIARQQNFSKPTQINALEQPVDLLEEALQLSVDQRPNSDIEIVRDYQPVAAFRVNRHKVLQILLNLITNGRNACAASDRQDKQIVLRTCNAPSCQVMLQVVDNGIGISPEAMKRIFEDGHTTKNKVGQGLGLHTSSLAASELGGKLTIESDGEGLGTTSTLLLPCTLREK